MAIDIRTIETTDGLFISLDDTMKLLSEAAWGLGSMPMMIFHNQLMRGELFNGERHIESNKGSAHSGRPGLVQSNLAKTVL